MSELQLEIVTPEKKIVSTPVVVCSCPGVAGEFGVLKDHISLLSALKIGALHYRTKESNEEHYVFVSGGFADVNNNVLTVLAESAENAKDIDAARAEAAKSVLKPVSLPAMKTSTAPAPRPPSTVRSYVCPWLTLVSD